MGRARIWPEAGAGRRAEVPPCPQGRVRDGAGAAAADVAGGDAAMYDDYSRRPRRRSCYGRPRLRRRCHGSLGRLALVLALAAARTLPEGGGAGCRAAIETARLQLEAGSSSTRVCFMGQLGRAKHIVGSERGSSLDGTWCSERVVRSNLFQN